MFATISRNSRIAPRRTLFSETDPRVNSRWLKLPPTPLTNRIFAAMLVMKVPMKNQPNSRAAFCTSNLMSSSFLVEDQDECCCRDYHSHLMMGSWASPLRDGGRPLQYASCIVSRVRSHAYFTSLRRTRNNPTASGTALQIRLVTPN